MPLADSRSLLADVVRRCFMVPETLTIDQWIDANRVVPDYSPWPGKWDTLKVQWARKIMRDFTDPAVRQIVLMCGTQMGKSEVMASCLFYTIACDPAPTMWVMDSSDQAEVVMKDRIRPGIDASPTLNQYKPSDRSDKALKRYRFDTMSLYMSGAGSAGQLAAKSIKNLFCDEIDKWPEVLGGRGGTEDAAIRVVESRTHAFGDQAKIIKASSPTDEGRGIAKQYEASERHQYHMPCPECSAYQRMRFSIDGKGGLRWEGGSGARLNDQELMQLRKSLIGKTWYECEHCGFKIFDHHRPRLIALGVWALLGQTIVVQDEKALKKFDPWDPKRPYRDIVPPMVELLGEEANGPIRGYQGGQFISNFVPLHSIADEFVQNRGAITRSFVNNRLGEPWKESGAKAAEGMLLDIAKKTPEGEDSYKRAAAPAVVRSENGLRPAVLALMGTIDVQQNGIYYVVRGYGAREETWLVDWGFVEWPQPVNPATGELMQAPDPDLASEQEMARWLAFQEDASAYVVALTQRRYALSRPEKCPRVVGAVADDTMPVQVWGIDSGDRTDEVYTLVERLGVGNHYAMKGLENISQPYNVKVIGVDAAVAGRSMAARLAAGAGVQLLEFKNLHWKDELFRRMWMRPPTYGAFRWPLDLDSEYDRQMGAEHRTRVNRGRSIADRWEWQKRPGRNDNHFWDCEVMQVVLAKHLRVDELARPAPEVVRGPRPGYLPG